jgi:hypothetical protein
MLLQYHRKFNSQLPNKESNTEGGAGMDECAEQSCRP